MSSRGEAAFAVGCSAISIAVFSVPIFILATLLGTTFFDLGGYGGMLLGLAAAVGFGYLYYISISKGVDNRQSSAPSGIRILNSRTIPEDVKKAVSVRDGGKCRVCGSTYDLQYDHIIPHSLGGSSDDVDNIQLLCGRCNRHKSNRYVG
jgi:hypothetical protein